MRLFNTLAALTGLALMSVVEGFSPTDTLMDGDSMQSGYLPNHNMDPAVVGGGSFGQIWRYTTPPPANGLQEQLYAKPLVYTPKSTGRQIVIAMSEQNRIYAIDAANGTLVASRDLAREGEGPFSVADLGSCNDIAGTIGVTGTGVIDSNTDTVYFWAKSYLQPGQSGFQNGAYRFHAVDAATLLEKPGFPTNIQGAMADNDNTRWFTGGTVLQRASLNMVNGVIFAGFGGHCDAFNFTGWVVGMSTTGKYLTGYVTSGGPGSPPQDGTFNGGGGGSGIWMAGMPIVSDNPGRVFFATGNGYKVDINQQQPASGRVHLSTLSECMVNLAVDKTTGALTQADYFETYEYLALDQADRDIGAGGICLPDPATFSGGGVARLAINCGKNGKCYVTNADDLGGYKLGPGGGDAIVQSIVPPSGLAIFSNVGTYPLEGGYLYITPVNSPTYVYKLGFSSSGLPLFTLAAQTDDNSAARVGTGPATITTNNGQPGSGILWIMDPDAGVRAYQAVPVNGKMIRIPLPASSFVSKFQRPAFGDGRYYISTSAGAILAFGSPVALPLNCTSPVNFGSVPIGNMTTMTVTCKANIAITKFNGFIMGTNLYKVSNSSLPTGALAAGSSFSFPVTFDLTNYVLNASSSSAPSVSPGVQTTAINILTTNGVTGFANEQPISLTGKSVSASPFVSMSPLQVSFASIVLGTTAAQQGSDSTFIISNIGQGNMTILGYAFTNGSVSDPTTYHNVSKANLRYVIDGNGYFTSSNLPVLGTVVPGGGAITINANFLTTKIGDYFTTLRVYTDGGSAYTLFTGSASTSPIALFERSTNEGGWTAIGDCADASVGCTYNIDMGRSLGLTINNVKLRFTNNGGSALTITKSKPPEVSAASPLGATNPNTDLSEGLTIAPGNSSVGTVSFSPGASQLNSDDITYSGVWTLNTNDLNFGVHSVNFTGVLYANQTGPLNSAGRAIYKYLGCYKDQTNNVRIEPQKAFVNSSNTNGFCQNQAFSSGAVFAGTEYVTECYVGSIIPNPAYKVADSTCGYPCAGDASQICGGNGGYISLYYDSTRYFPNNGTISGGGGHGPQIVKSVGPYVYAGCYTDATGSRSLTGPTQSPSGNSIESCAAFCNGYAYFGTEYGVECYCGTGLKSTGVLSPNTDCAMTCAGNSSEYCGAGNRLSVYALNNTVIIASSSTSTNTMSSSTGTASSTQTSHASGPTVVSKVGTYSYVDCHSDSTAQRTLTGLITNAVSIEDCASKCTGFLFFGMEYSTECYCGNSLLSSSTTTTDGRCSMTCSGNNTEICGGPNGLSLYSTNTTYIPTTTASASGSTTTALPPSGTGFGCPQSNGAIYTAASGRTYQVECYIDHAAGDLTMMYANGLNGCIDTCDSTAGCIAFSYVAGIGASPCYMKNTIGPPNPNSGVWGGKMVVLPSNSSTFSTVGSSISSMGGSASSTTVSSGSASRATGTVASTSTSSTTSTTSPSSSSSSVTTLSSSITISSSAPSSTSTTISSTSTSTLSFSSSCTSSSSSTSTTISSTDITSSMSTSTATSSSTSTSTTMSPGDTTSTTPSTTSSTVLTTTSTSISTDTSIRTSTTSTTSTTTRVPSSATKTSTSTTSSKSSTTLSTSSSTSSSTTTSSSTSSSAAPTSTWVYAGCANDNVGHRALNGATTTSTTRMTIESCQTFCIGLNYPLAGLEYSSQCHCGTGLFSGSALGKTGCTSTCAGNAAETCGGASRLSVYNYTSTSYVYPSLVPYVGRANLKGCYSDVAGMRTLANYTYTSTTSMTVENCVNTCKSKGYSMSGVEFASECHCGNVILNSPTLEPITDCQSLFCSGNKEEYCGAARRILVYA